MDYEKKYNEALERAKKTIEDCGGNEGRKKMIRDIFPELKESEDDKIRKSLIHHFMNKTKPYWNELAVKDIIAYLEKQKEQKPAEWSEEDKRILDMLIHALARIGANTRTDSTSINYTFLREIDWLKSLPERFNLQPKQEWGEEDKRKLNRIYEILGHAADDKGFLTSKRIIGDNEAIELQGFLRSILSQPHWKPSEDQMAALYVAIGLSGQPVTLQSLYNDLNKLK